MQITPQLRAAATARDNAALEAKRGQIEVWPCMAAGVLTFLAMSTQWRVGPTGLAMGLDYQAIRPTAELLDLVLDQRAFHDIRFLEREALRIIRSRRNG